eukprot:11089-Pelagomonas_calceolata.AAC.3
MAFVQPPTAACVPNAHYSRSCRDSAHAPAAAVILAPTGLHAPTGAHAPAGAYAVHEAQLARVRVNKNVELEATKTSHDNTEETKQPRLARVRDPHGLASCKSIAGEAGKGRSPPACMLLNKLSVPELPVG